MLVSWSTHRAERSSRGIPPTPRGIMSEPGHDYHEDLGGRLRAILILVADQLSRVTVELVTEFIDANECGLALETLSEMLFESGAKVSSQLVVEMRVLAEKMRLDGQVGKHLDLLEVRERDLKLVPRQAQG